jgi:Spy/CpxP family protein refolding chaperone
MSDMNTFNNPSELKSPVKRSTKRTKIIISSVLLVFIITGIAGLGFAKGFYDKHRPHGKLGFMLEMVVKDLDLNDQQKSEVEKIKNEIKVKMDAKKEARKNDMDEMEKMFRSDNFDKTKALEMSKKHDADREEMKSFMIDEMAKFHAILTSEQRNKAADKMKEFRDKKHNKKDKWNKE